MKKIALVILSFVTLFTACKNTKEEKIIHLLNEWSGRTIHFPQDMNLISYVDTNSAINFNEIKKEYTILHYVDTVGCISCKLQLSEWNKLIKELDSIDNRNVSCLISFFPMRKKELLKSLKINKFKHYIYIDERDSLNRLNNFPEEDAFRTFLLDNNDKVIAVGNPIHNPNVKELYLKIIRGEKVELEKGKNDIKTEVDVDKVSIDLGSFDWKKIKKIIFTLKNTGDKPLVIQNINASCGCTTVSYSQEPVQPGKEIKLDITYKADYPEHFSKTITVYCNTESSPIRLTISGDAK